MITKTTTTTTTGVAVVAGQTLVLFLTTQIKTKNSM